MKPGKLAGILLIVFGALFAGTGGLCCLIVLPDAFANQPYGIDWTFVALSVGPLALGVIALIAGIMIMRKHVDPPQ